MNIESNIKKQNGAIMKKLNSLFILIIFILMSFNLSACHLKNFDEVSDDNLQVLQEKSFQVKSGENLTLTTTSGDVKVIAWDKQEVHVKITGNDRAKEKVEFKFEQSGGTVKIDGDYDRPFFSSNRVVLRYEVYVPSKFNSKVFTKGGNVSITKVEGKNELKTSGGNIAVTDNKGDLLVSTSGGNIVMENQIGRAKVSTSGGDIRINGINGDLIASTSGGNVKIKANDSKIDASTSGGNISLDYYGLNKGIELSTSGGNITITVPKDFNAYTLMSTSGGRISCELPTTKVVKITSSKFEADLGNGGTKFVAKTSGGDIDLIGR